MAQIKGWEGGEGMTSQNSGPVRWRPWPAARELTGDLETDPIGHRLDRGKHGEVEKLTANLPRSLVKAAGDGRLAKARRGGLELPAEQRWRLADGSRGKTRKKNGVAASQCRLEARPAAYDGGEAPESGGYGGGLTSTPARSKRVAVRLELELGLRGARQKSPKIRRRVGGLPANVFGSGTSQGARHC